MPQICFERETRYGRVDRGHKIVTEFWFYKIGFLVLIWTPNDESRKTEKRLSSVSWNLKDLRIQNQPSFGWLSKYSPTFPQNSQSTTHFDSSQLMTRQKTAARGVLIPSKWEPLFVFPFGLRGLGALADDRSDTWYAKRMGSKEAIWERVGVEIAASIEANVEHLHEETGDWGAHERLREGAWYAAVSALKLGTTWSPSHILAQVAGAEGQDINALLGDDTVVRIDSWYCLLPFFNSLARLTTRRSSRRSVMALLKRCHSLHHAITNRHTSGRRCDGRRERLH
jgi:hypothetical protein